MDINIFLEQKVGKWSYVFFLRCMMQNSKQILQS